MGIFPQYSIKQYRPDFWKIIRFDVPHIPHVPAPRSGAPVNSEKFKTSLIRAKSVITQIAICNDWDWFLLVPLILISMTIQLILLSALSFLNGFVIITRSTIVKLSTF